MISRRAGLAVLAVLGTGAAAAASPGPAAPVAVYITWAANDELSDTVRLDERLALRELDAVARLKAQGAQIDYFLLDMGWFDRDGGYRRFRRADWPRGADPFLAACRARGVKPGLWFSTNVCGWSNPPWITPLPEWRDARGGYFNLAMSLYTGGFLSYQIETLQRWYDRGVRVFKFDFAELSAAPPAEIARLGPAEVERRNAAAWRDALEKFRARNPEVLILAYNGYGGDTSDTSPQFVRNVDPRWLDAFDSLYTGDPKPADLPAANFWRSLDIYSDAMVFQYAAGGIPLGRIDSSGFMIGNTGTIYRRGKAAWKGTLILSAARGGHVNTYYGDVALLDDADGAWFGKVQRLYFPFQARDQMSTFGAFPGTGLPYGFAATAADGAVYTVMNPGVLPAEEPLPLPAGGPARLLFTDAGASPLLTRSGIVLGPGQLAVVGTGRYADPAWDLGVQRDVTIPASVLPLELQGLVVRPTSAAATVVVPRGRGLRIIARQRGAQGRPWRVNGGAPPAGTPMAQLLILRAQQDGRPLRLNTPYDRQIWSGLSWAVAEVPAGEFEPDRPISISYEIRDPKGAAGTLSLSAVAVAP